MRRGWEEVGDWYDSIVGERGHYYHEHVILPKVEGYLKAWKVKSLLDLACGQGVLEKRMPPECRYIGVDASPHLVKLGQKSAASKEHQFFVQDLTRPISLPEKEFDAAALILAAQDMDPIDTVFSNAAKFLKSKGKLLIVMNHPCFRIPRQSGWGVEEAAKIQYRKVNRYMTPMAIPIRTRPSQGGGSPEVTFHHRPLSYYTGALSKAGFVMVQMEELVSDKESTGSKARMEGRARAEFPLFLCIVAEKR